MLIGVRICISYVVGEELLCVADVESAAADDGMGPKEALAASRGTE